MNEPVAVIHRERVLLATWAFVVQFIGWAVIDAVVFGGIFGDPLISGYTLRLPVTAGLAAGQFSIVGGWLALGGGRWYVRLGAIIICSVLFTTLTRFSEDLIGFIPTSVFALLTYSVTIALPLLILRWFGWACSLPDEVALPWKRAQFRLSHLFIATTLIACGLGLMRMMRFGDVEALGAGALGGLILGLIPWTLWIAMLRKHLECAISTAVAVFLLSTLIGGYFFNMGPWLVVNTIQIVVLAINLGLLRYCGYRLRRAVTVVEPAREVTPREV